MDHLKNTYMIKALTTFFLCTLLAAAKLPAQALLEGIEDSIPATEKVTGAFKSTRVINAHSIEMLYKRNLDFRIMHRFGNLNSGIKELYGLDHASMRMSLDYGISENTTVGFGRSTLRKELDVFVKTRIIQQSTGTKNMPLSLVLVVGGAERAKQGSFDSLTFIDRSAYYVQMAVGRKFSSLFSFQLSPIIVHTVTPVEGSDQTIFALGGGARLKVSKRIAFTIDYHHPFGTLNQFYTDPLSVGIDIETGGHVFQLHFSNTDGMNERAYITQTSGDFFKGDIRFGFNLSRLFQLGKN
jgi:hypothetical protein